MHNSIISNNLSTLNYLTVAEVIGLSNCMVIANQAYIVEANGYDLMLRIFSKNLDEGWLKHTSLESLVSEDLSLFITDMNMDVEVQVLKVYQNLGENNTYVDIKIQLASSLPEYWVDCFADTFTKKSVA